jgi:hypothetical protein
MKSRHRANPLMLLPGVLLVIVGVVVAVIGFAYAALSILGMKAPEFSDLGAPPDARGDMQPLLDGFAVVIVGLVAMTIGRYLWRGARKRGWRDRLGRLLIIVGYLIIGVAFVALTRFVLDAMGHSDGTGIVFRGLITCLAIAVPGVVLASIGFRLAREVPLLEAEAKAEF